MKTLREAAVTILPATWLGIQTEEAPTPSGRVRVFFRTRETSQITSRLALLWATQPKQIQPAEWATRLGVVRGFARYWSATDATIEVPPNGLLPYRPSLPARQCPASRYTQLPVRGNRSAGRTRIRATLPRCTH